MHPNKHKWPVLVALKDHLVIPVSVLLMNWSSTTVMIMFVDAAGGTEHIRAFQHTLQSATQTRPAALQSDHQLDHSGLDNFTLIFLFLYVWNKTVWRVLSWENDQ